MLPLCGSQHVLRAHSRPLTTTPDSRMSAGWQDLLRRLRENDDLEFLKSVLHGCDACGAATPSSASLLRSRRAVARACIPGPRARRPTSAPDGSGPCCMHMYPEYMGVLHVRAHDGCAQRLARRWRLQLIQRPRQRAQRRRPKHVAHDAAAIARALRREPRAISVNRLEIIASSAFTFTHTICVMNFA
jgi:hypothetical protein